MKASDVEVKKSLMPDSGDGLFALRPFRKSEFIVEYTGVRIPTKEADQHHGRYLFEIDKDWTIDGEPSNSPARFINHSCAPNAEAEVHDGHILISAVNNIAGGDEITID